MNKKKYNHWKQHKPHALMLSSGKVNCELFVSIAANAKRRNANSCVFTSIIFSFFFSWVFLFPAGAAGFFGGMLAQVLAAV